MKYFPWLKFIVLLMIPSIIFGRANIGNRYFSDISRYVPYRAAASNLDLEGYGFMFDGSLWQSTGNYDQDGNSISFDAAQEYSSFNGSFTGQYAITRRLELRGGLRFRRNRSKSFSNIDTKEVSGLESWKFGLQYMFPRKSRWFHAVEGKYRGTAYTNSIPENGILTDQLVLGDSGRQFELMFHMGYERKPTNIFSGTLGVRVPPEELSEEIIFNLESAWIFSRSALVVGAFGVWSLNRDPFGDNGLLKPRFDDAPTNLFNSVNRSYVEPFVRLNYSLSKSATVGLSYGQVVFGQSWDTGSRIGLHFHLTSEGKSVNELVFDKFKDYEVEAGVVKVSPRERFIKIDRGLASEVRKGMKFDIYQFDYLGGNVLIATGFVYEVSADTAVIRIRKKYRNVPIKVGFVARGN